jgi:hypothetical protein
MRLDSGEELGVHLLVLLLPAIVASLWTPAEGAAPGCATALQTCVQSRANVVRSATASGPFGSVTT